MEAFGLLVLISALISNGVAIYKGRLAKDHLGWFTKAAGIAGYLAIALYIFESIRTLCVAGMCRAEDFTNLRLAFGLYIGFSLLALVGIARLARRRSHA